MKNNKFQYILIFILSILLFSCSKSKLQNSNTTNIENSTNENSQVQLIHASPGIIGIKMWYDDNMLQEVGNYYKSNSHYLNIPSGKRKLDLKLSKSNDLLFSISRELKPNSKYSYFATDTKGKFTGLLVQDDILPLNPDKAQLRIVNILSNDENIDLNFENGIKITNIKEKSATNYQYFEKGSFNLSITNSIDKSTIIKNVLIYLDPGVVYTLYVNGFTNKTGSMGADAILVVNH
ncbi:MAG TPA: DUF4397 domain-containing protein [Chitinophagaceae bacterium]|nr:DUF4397 domain-containing protein [Chitinophagaceae bacterium]